MPTAALIMPQSGFSQHFQPCDLDRLGHSCTLISRRPFVSVDALLSTHAASAESLEVIVTGWGSRIETEKAMAAFPNLKLIAHAAGTAKAVVEPRLIEHGVRLTTSARANAEPVAEFLLSWILRWNKRLDAFEGAYRQAREDYVFASRGSQDLGNMGRAVGVISGSNVGRALIRMLRPFQIECLLYDPFVSADAARMMGARKVDLETIMGSCDVVSLNAPMLPETIGMIGAKEFAALKDGALFINTARGPLVDHAAMAQALRTGRFTAVLDVTDPEPLPSDSPLWDLPNVHITPHVAGSLGGEISRMTDWCLSEVERFIQGEPLLSEIRLDDWERAA